MFPAFDFLGRTIAIYPVLALAGIFAAGLFACRLAKKRGLSVDDMIVFLLISGVGVLIGSHLLYGLVNFPLLIQFFSGLGNLGSPQEFLSGAVAVFGGSIFYGGLLGGIAAGMCYGAKKGLDMPAHADILAPAVPLFHIFGRIGCFLGGCCYGVECDFGVVYEHALAPQANGVRRLPVQLLEAGFNLLLFLLLFRLLKKGVLKGRLFFLYLLLYPVGRFLLEFLRGDAYRGIWLGLSTSQWISLALFPAALICLFLRRNPLKKKDGKVEDA